jgi:hypothetical protein
MAEKSGKKTWVWVVVGLLVVLVVGFAVFIGLSMMVVTRNMKVTEADEPSAERRFEEARARFAGQAPLVTLEEDAVVSRAELDRRTSSYKGPAPKEMWVMAWDPKDQRLVTMSIPFWLLRLSPSSHVSIELPGIGERQSNITTADLEGAGPGLFLDGTVEGAMVLIWTE